MIACLCHAAGGARYNSVTPLKSKKTALLRYVYIKNLGIYIRWSHKKEKDKKKKDSRDEVNNIISIKQN